MGRFAKAIAAGIGAPLIVVASYLIFKAVGWTPSVPQAEVQDAVREIISIAITVGIGSGMAVYRIPNNAE